MTGGAAAGHAPRVAAAPALALAVALGWPGVPAADEPPPEIARGRYRIMLAPVRPSPAHRTAWARDADAAVRRELAAIPWIEVVDPLPRLPGTRAPDLSDWASAIREARRARADAFLRGSLEACVCDLRSETRTPWQGWITLELKLNHVGDAPSGEASHEDYVTGPSEVVVEAKVPGLVGGMVAALIPQVLTGLFQSGRVIGRLDERRFLLDRGLADGLRSGARLALVLPGREDGKTGADGPPRTGELEVTTLAESTAVAELKSGTRPSPGQWWRRLPARPVPGGALRGIIQGLGSVERCCP